MGGTGYAAAAMKRSSVAPARSPHVLVFDSGLGGLTVYDEIVRLRPDADYTYVADDGGFPYGRLSEAAVIARVGEVMARLIGAAHPDMVVVACNTASTLVLPSLRAAYPDLPFVGTVPAIKPAALASASGLISVLATPGTVARDYTHDLVRTYAAHCAVTLVGSRTLANCAEAFMQGEAPDRAAIAAEIAPCFVQADGRRTDCVVLACTHYPLLLRLFDELAPWPVTWIDPAPAIARRVDHVLQQDLGFAAAGRPRSDCAEALFTGRAPGPTLAAALARRGFAAVAACPMPLLAA